VRFAGAKTLQLLAQNALIYGIFIMIVREQETALVTSAFVLTAILPSIVLSVPGGVVADALPIKITMLASMAARVGLAWLLLTNDVGIAGLISLTVLWWTISQFLGPAEAASLPAIVAPRHIAPANAILDGISLTAQLAGAGVIAPLVLKASDDNGLFLTVLLLLLASMVLYSTIPAMTPSQRPLRKRDPFWTAMPRGFRILRSSPSLVRVTTLKILLDSGLAIIAVAAPAFIADLLRTDPANAVYIFAPGAVGIAIGLLVAPILLRGISSSAVATFGFLLLVGVVLTLPFINEVSRELGQRTFMPVQQTEELLHVSTAIAGTVLLLPFGGLGVSFVRVASRTAVYEHAPAGAVAQVFATQSGIGSLISPLPTMGAGLMVDYFEVRAVLITVGIIMAAGPIFGAIGLSRFLTRGHGAKATHAP
jgi:hypothetical protein